jgi:hypothetical protein
VRYLGFMVNLGPFNKFGARGGVRNYTFPIGRNHVYNGIVTLADPRVKGFRLRVCGS